MLYKKRSSYIRKHLNPILAYYGEFQARHYLAKRGYKILSSNWRLKFGELDIIAFINKELVFVEVKTRRAVKTNAFPAADAVDYKKIIKIKKIAEMYMDRNEKLIKNLKIENIRYDVIGITVRKFGRLEIEHRIDAFD